MMSSESWKTVPISSAYAASARCTDSSAPATFAPNRAEVAIREAVLSATTDR